MKASEKLNRLITERRLNRAALATRAGVSYSTFRSYLESGSARIPGADTGAKIAASLGVPADWLWDDAQDWPPPEKSGPSDLGDMELVAELRRRIDLVLRDFRAVTRRLRTGVDLARLDAIARKAFESCGSSLTPAEIAELKAITADFETLIHLIDRVNQAVLSIRQLPAQSGDFLKEVEALLQDRPGLARLYEQAYRRENPWVLASREGGRPYVRSGGIGRVIDREAYCRLSVFDQRGFVPVLRSVRAGAPTERPVLIYPGQLPPEHMGEFVRFDTDDPRAFGYRVPDANQEPDLPRGSVVVCRGEPIAGTKRELCVVLFQGGEREGVYDVDGKALHSRDGTRFPSIKIAGRDAVVRYPVIAQFPAKNVRPAGGDAPAAGDSPAASPGPRRGRRPAGDAAPPAGPPGHLSIDSGSIRD